MGLSAHHVLDSYNQPGDEWGFLLIMFLDSYNQPVDEWGFLLIMFFPCRVKHSIPPASTHIFLTLLPGIY